MAEGVMLEDFWAVFGQDPSPVCAEASSHCLTWGCDKSCKFCVEHKFAMLRSLFQINSCGK